MSEDPKETGTGTWKVHGRYMESTWKEHGRNLDDSGNTTRRGTGNRTIRTIGIRKYLRRDLTTMGNRVGSGHPCTGLGSGYFGFSSFLGVARKLVKVSEIAEMPQEIAWEALGSCSGSLGKSWEVLGSVRKGTELF